MIGEILSTVLDTWLPINGSWYDQLFSRYFSFRRLFGTKLDSADSPPWVLVSVPSNSYQPMDFSLGLSREQKRAAVVLVVEFNIDTQSWSCWEACICLLSFWLLAVELGRNWNLCGLWRMWLMLCFTDGWHVSFWLRWYFPDVTQWDTQQTWN